MHLANRLKDSLYRPKFERDNCGFGLVAQMDNVASHQLVLTAIESLTRMTHRGAIAADGKTGDGCGLLIQKPDAFFRRVASDAGIQLSVSYGVGTIFLSQEVAVAQQAMAVLNQALTDQGLVVAGWRQVPVDPECCGDQAIKMLPEIKQVFVNKPEEMDDAVFNRCLFIARRIAEKALDSDEEFYITSLSSRVISYKGLVMPHHLPHFYLDLNEADFESAICVYHQRFSTNTQPQWRLSQPFRVLAHNGEINTVEGNRFWSVARIRKLQSKLLPDVESLAPLVSTKGSDSQSFDNMLDVLLNGGLSIFRAMRLLVPPAWEKNENMDPELRAFYQYSSMMMESWDGPAGIVLTDGRYAACTLDRNGLRPARWVITKDRVITIASEIGTHDYAAADVLKKGRLKPGQMLAVDTQTGKLLSPSDVDQLLKTENPYPQWVADNVNQLGNGALVSEEIEGESLDCYQKLFGVSFEERDQVVRPLAEDRQEATGSMGDDTPVAVLSEKVRPLYDYFRQQFAQVTNPPIDPLRENIVMSLTTRFGVEQNVFEDSPACCQCVVTGSPVLTAAQYQSLKALDSKQYAHAQISLAYEAPSLADGNGLTDAIRSLCQQAEDAVRSGKVIIILSDRVLSRDSLQIHVLLATGAVHHHLTKLNLRSDANIVVETGTVRDSHHMAALIGFGATAVYPYLAYAMIENMVHLDDIALSDCELAIDNYVGGLNKGLDKIMSKVGISQIKSYRGAQLFEVIGLHDDVVELCFEGVTSRIQGCHFADLEEDQITLSRAAWSKRKPLEQGGLLKYVHNGEYHAFNPDVVIALQQAVKTGDQKEYDRFASLVNDRPAAALRDLLGLVEAESPIALDEVEPVSEIVKRFDTAAMSLGALSPEAHEALAIAMNRLGGRSNSGEGGESPARYRDPARSSKIKQIASGRFGVTPDYLSHAEVIQIKMAQGAKPGEGGQLPGKKVNDMIAELRYTRPGVTLISPPPHHDIYSIEDLAQLIFDLKQVNPRAQVSVKLVAKEGVGTIASGVAKAYADLITISGYDGGTGASPLTSIRNAGIPWEIGLAETHQCLVGNDLRNKVKVQADGGLKTGLDVVKAAILGAESFGFGTAPMVALGCKYLRICHLNNCATGIATQRLELRRDHFIGLPEMVENYFRFVAEEVRQIMAKLGVRSVEELVGKTELMKTQSGTTTKQRHLDLSPLLFRDGLSKDLPQHCLSASNDPYDKGLLAEQMVEEILPSIEQQMGGVFAYDVRNTDRSVGARLSGEIARRYGNLGMQSTPVNIKFQGTAGQSFGVWNAGGLNLELEGDANDYVGKGMAGGKITIYPPRQSAFKSNDAPIIGNTCLYGATAGSLFAAGRAGERFAVRNSGAHAVVEGVGDHGCEYMTGGVVVVLGSAGGNFGAGMTGGFAYVLDLRDDFETSYNPELVGIHRLTTPETSVYSEELRQRIECYVEQTASEWGEHVLSNFDEMLPKFWLVAPSSIELSQLLDIATSGPDYAAW